MWACRKTLVFVLIGLTFCGLNPLYGQVGKDLCRHFIVSIDKYPGSNNRYLHSDKTIDATIDLLNSKFHIGTNDYVSVIYYGINKKARSNEDFITQPFLNGCPLLWMRKDSYESKWRDYIRVGGADFEYSGSVYSLQKASYSYSFYAVSKNEKVSRKVNITYLLRITDNVENNWLGAVAEYEAYLDGSSISEQQWTSVIDIIESNYTFEEVKCGDNRYAPINGKYGIYCCQVLSKEKPVAKSVIEIRNLNAQQIKQGHQVSFDYSENDGYNIERFQVAYRNSLDSLEPIFDSSSAPNGYVEFMVPETQNIDSLNLDIKLWVSRKNVCGSMIISPYDSVSGDQLEEVIPVKLEHSKILGMPLNQNWPWFSDNAQQTSLIWTIIFVVLFVVFLFAVYFILRKYHVTCGNTDVSVENISIIRVNLTDKNKGETERLNVAKIKIIIKKPIWSKGRSINEQVKAEICLNEQDNCKFILDPQKPLLSLNQTEIHIKDYTTELEVHAHPESIVDYIESQTEENCRKHYPIKASFQLKNSSGGKIASEEVNLDVLFEEIEQTPEIKLSGIDDANCQTVFFDDRIHDLELCTYEFVRTSNLKRMPKIVDTIPSLSCDKCEALRIENGKIILDMGRLSNPRDDFDEFPFVIKCRYSEHGYTQAKEISKQFVLRVRRNETRPELSVKVRDRIENVWKELKNGEERQLSDIHFIRGDNLCEFWNDIKVENTAQQGALGASIRISQFIIEPSVTQRDAQKAYENDETAFIDFKEPDLPIRLFNGRADAIKPKVGWNAFNRCVNYNDAQNKRRYDITVSLKIKFNYAIDRLGNGFFDKDLEYSSILTYKVYQDPVREWLGIDFGTSAIVALYTDDGGIRDLHQVKNELYKSEDYRDDSYEEGTEFLSSNVIFRDNSGDEKYYYPVQSQDQAQNNEKNPYHEAAICLSPTSSLEKTFRYSVMPCLKMMVGYEELPMLDALRGKSYNFGNTEVTFGNNKVNPLVRVDNVFREVYDQLLRFFVLPTLNDTDVENVILTVPNTYTSSNLKILEECLMSSSIASNIRNIRFVSESDAVACYYQSNWASLNTQREQLSEENILVYDMGAGTLDISLLNRHVDENNQKTTITVIGKIGAMRAGNFLDTILAETLSEHYPDCNLSELLRGIFTTEDFNRASDWKNFIKNKLKPLLNSETKTFTLTRDNCDALEDESSFQIDLDELRSSEQYNNYLESCSSGILETFFTFQGYDKKDNRPQIDTLVLSGRASNQKKLIDYLRKAINEWCGDGVNIVPLWRGNRDALKTSVIEGGATLVSRFSRKDSGVVFRSNNITADYGVIYKDNLGNTCYMEILDHKETHSCVKTINGVDHYVYHKEHNNVNLQDVTQLTLVQTYTKEPVLSDGTISEYCTVMNKYDVPEDVDRTSLSICLDIDENGEISITIGGASSRSQAANQVDLKSEVYEKGLWPMMNGMAY